MKTFSFARGLKIFALLGLTTLLAGCFETRDEFTVNPDGSGKVIHECTFQEINLGGNNEPTEDALKESIGKIISEAKGVEAWRDVTYQRQADGRLYFKGTAYFTNLNALDLPNQTMLEFDWRKTGAGAVLTLRTNKSGKQNRFDPEDNPVDPTTLPPAERAAKLQAERARFQQARAMMSAVMGSMKHEAIFHLPGKLGETSNFTPAADGAVRLQFEGAKLLAAMDKLVNDDAWAMKNFSSLGGQEKPALDEELNAFVFGSKAPVRAVVTGGSPLFNYATEVAVARKETENIRKQLGVGSVVVGVAAPATGGALQGVKVVGVRWISETGPKNSDFRPFNYDAGYAVVLRVDFPGSIVALTDESTFTRAIADDGSDLLPASDWNRKIRWPKLSEDKAAALIEVELKLPAPRVNGLKELAGRLEYQVSGGTKQVELGFGELKNGARGTELGAQIKSIKPGWNNDGTQQLELKLNLSKEALQTMWLVVDGSKTELNQRGYSGGGNTYTFTYECKGTFPAQGKLVAEVFDQMQTFTATFKLENLTLLGAPAAGK